MASERAKELAAKQKAEAKAAKLRKKQSQDPNDWGTVRQIIETFKMTIRLDPKAGWLIGAAVGLPLIVGLIVGFVLDSVLLSALTGLLVGLSLGLLVLTNRGKRAAYKRYEGQPGSGQIALMMLNSKKWSYTAAIAGNKQGDAVHRAIGPGGLILVGEGDPGRVRGLLANEKRRHEQVTYNVEVHVYQVGEGEGQIPVEKLTKQIEKLPKSLTADQISDIENRLRALDSMRQRVPLPKGPLPTSAKGTRRAMRGR